jgi:hypothetical protein
VRQGVPEALISKGCITAGDARALAEVVRATRAERIVEVGTFIGASALFLAWAAGPHARVLTIDPAFPLSLQTSAFGTLDERPCTALARDAADAFGRAGCITFATGYSSRYPGAEMIERLDAHGIDWRSRPLVSETVSSWGAIHFAFVDGEHSADAVSSDLALISDGLRPSGVIAVHDVDGRWGDETRAGIDRFLAAAPMFRLTTDGSLGFLRRRPDYLS